MALSRCHVETDSHGRELTLHGGAMFPIASYDENFMAHLVPWHWHDDLEFILIVAGRAHIQVEGQTVVLSPGGALLINSGVLHSVNNGAPENARCHSMVFHPRLIGGSMESVFWQKLILPLTQNKSLRCVRLDSGVPWQASVIAHMREAWQADAEEPEDYENIIRYLLSKAFRILNLNLQAQPLVEKAAEKETLAAERTKTMMQYIHAHYTEELSLDEVAASASVSKSVCLRSFRQTIGMTPMRYVLQYRIEKAAELLLHSEQRAGEAATACGFSDISYFTKCFREVKGCTPLEYRRLFSKTDADEPE